MSLAFRCSQCGKTYTKNNDWAGKVVNCEGCGKAMRIPTPLIGVPVTGPPAAGQRPVREWDKPTGTLAPKVPVPPPIPRGYADDQGAAGPGPVVADAGKKSSLVRNILSGVVGVLVLLGMVGRYVIRPYLAWQRAQSPRQQAVQIPPDAIPQRLLQPGHPSTSVQPSRPPWRMPALPPLGDGTLLQPGIRFYEVHLPGGGQVGNPLTIPGHGGKLWLYLPEGDHAPRSLPCILIAGAGTNLMTGMTLGDGDRPEHLPYVRQGFAVLAYELDGMLPDPQPTTDAGFAPYIRSFVNAEAGLVNMRVALEFATTRVPEVDPKRLFAAGHSSAGTLSLLVAENEPRIAACVAFAPVVDLNEHIPEPARQAVSLMVPGADQLFTRFNPRAGESNLRCPLFLFVAQDDPIASQDGELVGRLVAMGRSATMVTVPRGGHYDPMIRTGIPRAIAWLKSLRPTANGLRPVLKANPAPRAKNAQRRPPGAPKTPTQPGVRKPQRTAAPPRQQQQPPDE